MFELFEHTADLGLRVTASDQEGLFVEAARGLVSIIVDDPGAVRPVETVSIRIDGADPAFLLFDWLSELLGLFESQRFLGADFDVGVTSGGLQATVRGEPMDPERHRPAHEVKAITYHGLVVEPTDTGWRAEVIVDI